MLKKIVLVTLTLAMLILLWGCPYRSQIALGDAVEKTQQRVLGSWVAETQAAKETPDYYVVKANDSVNYAIEYFQYNKEEKAYTSKNYIGHSTTISGFMFMNLMETGSKEYLLYRIDFVPNGLVLYEVTDNIDEKFNSSEKMYAFFEKNMRHSFFYSKDEVPLVRKPKK